MKKIRNLTAAFAAVLIPILCTSPVLADAAEPPIYAVVGSDTVLLILIAGAILVAVAVVLFFIIRAAKKKQK